MTNRILTAALETGDLPAALAALDQDVVFHSPILATTGNLADTFQPFGVGMPQVAVTSIQVNQNLNTLTIGTNGHGAFQFFLDDQAANSGALPVVAGGSPKEGARVARAGGAGH